MSRQNSDCKQVMPLPTPVAAALTALQQAGHEAYVVGGCVRDFLRGVTPHDFDMATSATPAQVMALFAHLRVVPTGIAHGTVTVIADDYPMEITTFRVDGEYDDFRHPRQVKFTNLFREDCARRDFTVNAMGYSPATGVVDFFGGREDLKNRCIRAVGEPERRFTEDALRILRALRFAAVLGFTVEAETAAALRRLAPLLSHVANERVYTEVVKMLCGCNAEAVLTAYPTVVTEVFPELFATVGFDQHNRHHCHDVYRHTVLTVSHVPAEPVLRLAALLHDVGKPATYTVDFAGEGHFYGHAAQSTQLAEQALRRLRADGDTLHRTLELIKHHDEWLEPSALPVRRALAKRGERFFFDMLALKRADNLAQAPAYHDRQQAYAELERVAREVLAESPCLTLAQLAVKGEDVMSLGIPKGKQVGAALSFLHEGVLDGRFPNERQALLQILQENIAALN